jgi:hypothetical protein
VVTEFSRLVRPIVNRPGPALKVGSLSTRAERECDLVSLAIVIAYATDWKSGTNGGGSIWKGIAVSLGRLRSPEQK